MRQVAHICVTLRHSCGRKDAEIAAFRALFGAKSVVESPKWRESLPAQRFSRSLPMLQKCRIVAHSVDTPGRREIRASDREIRRNSEEFARSPPGKIRQAHEKSPEFIFAALGPKLAPGLSVTITAPAISSSVTQHRPSQPLLASSRPPSDLPEMLSDASRRLARARIAPDRLVRHRRRPARADPPLTASGHRRFLAYIPIAW